MINTNVQSNSPSLPILAVDDELHSLQGLDITLRSAGIDNLILCNDPLQVEKIAANRELELVLLDLMMPGISGKQLLGNLTRDYPDLPVIMVSGVNDVGTVVECVKQGAYDYVTKPLEGDRLVALVRRAIEARELRRENLSLKKKILGSDFSNSESFRRIITRSRKMMSIFHYCEAIAPGPYPVLITGETGVGKELIAEALHLSSGREGEFVPVNVAGLDDNVFSDTLFGHVRGAFTGADGARSGLVEKAGSGTLFLDEIGDMGPESQVRLLRLLDQREYYPLGSDMPKPTEARIVVATQVDLPQAIDKGLFRLDLFYRLRNHHIHLPPLRERKEDIPLLLEHFLAEAAEAFGREKLNYDSRVVSALKNYAFPGNVRELRSILLDLAGRSRDASRLTVANFEPHIGAGVHMHKSCPGPAGDNVFTGLELLPTLKESTHFLVAEALRRTGDNQRAAARLLGISPQALSQRLKREES